MVANTEFMRRSIQSLEEACISDDNLRPVTSTYKKHNKFLCIDLDPKWDISIFMTREEINDFCETVVPSEDVIVPDDLDDAFIGVALDEDPTRAVYSIEKCIRIYVKK